MKKAKKQKPDVPLSAMPVSTKKEKEPIEKAFIRAQIKRSINKKYPNA